MGCQKEIEDEEHFILKCEGYTIIRKEYKKKIEKIMKKTEEKKKEQERKRENNTKEKEWLEIFLGKNQNMEIIEISMEYLKRITSVRDRVQGKKIFKKLKKREIYI